LSYRGIALLYQFYVGCQSIMKYAVDNIFSCIILDQAAFKKEGPLKVTYNFAVLYICLCLLPIALYADEYYIQWADTLDNNDWDGAFNIAVDNSNNIIVTGSSFISGNNDYFTVKYDSSGTIIWADTIDNGDEDYAEAVAIDNSNNIIVTGYSMISGDYDYFTVKYDSNGTVLWQDTLDNNGLYDISRGVAVDGANSIFVTGYCDIDDDCVYFTVKYDSGGTIIWADTLDNGPFDSAFGVAVDNADNTIVTGYTSDGVDNDYFTVKYDSSGLVLWQDTIDIFQFDQAYGIAADNCNNTIVTGCSGGPFDDYDYFTVKYDPNGVVLWQDTLDNNNHDDVAYGVAVDNYDNIYVTGYTLELSGDYDYFTVKYDSNGVVLWQDILDNGDNDIARALAVDDFNNIYVTGNSYIGSNFDYFTVKYAPVSGISDRNQPTDIPGMILCDIHPNPFSDKTEIKFQFPESREQNSALSRFDRSPRCPDGLVSIAIYNAFGRLVRKYADSSVGLTNRIIWDGTDNYGNRLANGAYFLMLETESYKQTNKLLLVR